MRADLCDTKVILGVDRLDCIKGIPQKLHAFDRLLEQCPELVGHVVLLQVAIPSRDDLKAHQDLKEEIQQLVGKINGKYGRSSDQLSGGQAPAAAFTRSRPNVSKSSSIFHNSDSLIGKINHVPVQFLYTSIDPDELTALYAAADVCFVSSTRDGMNLVCYEYIACHSNKAKQSSREATRPGSLVLSKFTGAANLLDGALIVNPWNKESCADALAHALSMDVSEAGARMGKLASRVESQTRYGSQDLERHRREANDAIARIGEPALCKHSSNLRRLVWRKNDAVVTVPSLSKTTCSAVSLGQMVSMRCWREGKMKGIKFVSYTYLIDCMSGSRESTAQYAPCFYWEPKGPDPDWPIFVRACIPATRQFTSALIVSLSRLMVVTVRNEPHTTRGPSKDQYCTFSSISHSNIQTLQASQITPKAHFYPSTPSPPLSSTYL